MGNVASADSETGVVIDPADMMDTNDNGRNEFERDKVSNLDLSQLFDATTFRAAAANLVSDDVTEDLLQQHHQLIVQWLDDLLQDNISYAVTLNDFYDLMLRHRVSRDECAQAFHRFDVEDFGVIDAQVMLDFVKKHTDTASLHSDLGSVVRTLRSCTHTPGFFDIYNEEKGDVEQHAVNIVNFLLKNRASSSAFTVPSLSGFNDTTQLRQAAVATLFNKLKQTDSQTANARDDSAADGVGGLVTPVNSCISSYDVSSNKVDAHKLFSGVSYWQSDGVASSHWIRLNMKSEVIIQQLSVRVSSADRSYMPQQIVISVGSDLTDLHEIKDVRIPSMANGDILLLENARMHYPLVQVNISRCHNDGCDTRVHGIRVKGCRSPQAASVVSVTDSLATWYLRVISATVTACLPLLPQLQNIILQHSRSVLNNLPPLSMSSTSSDRPAYLSPYILREINSFLQTIATTQNGGMSPEGLDVLLAFHVAQGHVVNVLRTLQLIQESGLDEMPSGHLIADMEAAKDSLWKKHGGLVELKLAGCDGGQKENGSGPENVLQTSWSYTQTPFLSADGKTKVNMFFRANDQIQLTKLKIKVDRGPRGPHCGLVFVYTHEGDFVLAEHVALFDEYDSWRMKEYAAFRRLRTSQEQSNRLKPAAYFVVDDDWDEIEVFLDQRVTGQYVLVKLLEPRHDCSERLGIVGIKFYGFERKAPFLRSSVSSDVCDKVSASLVCTKTLEFLVVLVADQSKAVMKLYQSTGRSLLNADVSDLSMKVLWDSLTAYQQSSEATFLLLQLLHALLPSLAHSTHTPSASSEATERVFAHLCDIVDCSPTSSEADDHYENLQLIAQQVIADGAAVFFPNKEVRRRQLFQLVTDMNDEQERLSVTLKFQSLCQFFSSIDQTGLLGLPASVSSSASSTQTQTHESSSSSVLQVMNLLVSVAHRECMMAMDSAAKQSDKLPHLVHLLCSLQTSLLASCSQQLDTTQSCGHAEELILQYVQFSAAKFTDALTKFAEKEKEQMIFLVQQLQGSLLATAFPQMVLLLSHISNNLSSSARTDLLNTFIPVSRQLNHISDKLPELFMEMESEKLTAVSERPDEVLKVWDVESSHKYENNQHNSQVFSCPGATSFLVEFDPRCETERRYDYLEFTDAAGNKTRFDHKVNTDKWPLTKVFSPGPRLHFLFHSDSSNNEWGYKFRVTAKGKPDEMFCWMFDVHLSLSKLLGRLCGANLAAVTSTKTSSKDCVEMSDREFEHSELLNTVFASGCMQSDGPNVDNNISDETAVVAFLRSLVESREQSSVKSFLCKVKTSHHQLTNMPPSIGGPEVDSVIIAAFAALVWHTPTLRRQISRYVSQDSDETVSDELQHAYIAAETLRSALVEERQRLKVAKETASGDNDYDPVVAAKDKAEFLLTFTGVQAQAEVDEKHHSSNHMLEFLKNPSWSTERVKELISRRCERAQAIAATYKFLNELISDDVVFKSSTMMLLQELLSYQDKFGCHYTAGLQGSGPSLEADIRSSYYTLIQRLIHACRSGSVHPAAASRSSLANYHFIVATTLHLLCVNWKPNDLTFLAELRLAEFYYTITTDSIVMVKNSVEQCDDTKELETYNQCMKWLEEAKNGFSSWYDRQTKNRLLQTFIARYCSVLEVSITCDGCGAQIPGPRYHCLDCMDIDLCGVCFSGGVMPSASEHTTDHSVVYMTYKCDGCQGFIIGTRVHCNECNDFDLCLCCQNSLHYPAGHHSSHTVTEYPPVQWRMTHGANSPLKAYVHQLAWLQYSSLALTAAAVLYSECDCSVDAEVTDSATQLYETNVQTTINYFTEHTDVDQQNTVDQHATADQHAIADQDTTADQHAIADQDTTADQHAIADQDTTADHPQLETALLSCKTRQLLLFQQHFEERIMGLLGALIPDVSKNSLVASVSERLISEEFVALLVNILADDSSGQHFAFGIIKLLLLYVPASVQVFDSVLRASIESDKSADVSSSSHDVTGYHTVRFLFVFGSSCFERVKSDSLEWAAAVASLLRRLYELPTWQPVITETLSTYIAAVTDSSQSLFAFYVVAGFPDVPSLGAVVQYVDGQSEPHEGIIVKHIDDKCDSILVDKKSHRRLLLSDEQLEVVHHDVCCLSDSQLPLFTHLIADTVTKLQSGVEVPMNTTWMLAVALKSLVQAVKTRSSCELATLFESQFVESISYLAMQGTGFSQHWIVTDLEILLLRLYARRSRPTALVETTDDKRQTSTDASVATDFVDPLDSLDDSTKETFQVLHDHLKIKYSVLRAYFEKLDRHEGNLVAVLHANLSSVGSDFIPTDRAEKEAILELAKRWEPGRKKELDVDSDKDIDVGIQLLSADDEAVCNAAVDGDVSCTSSAVLCMETVRCMDEDADAVTGPVSMPDCDCTVAIMKQRRLHSSALLMKQQKLSPASLDMFTKINQAIAVLYARQLLMSLLADWPTSGHVITADLLSCSASEHLPYALDLLNRQQSQHLFSNVVENVVGHWQPVDSLTSLAHVGCELMNEVGLRSVVSESPHASTDSDDDGAHSSCEIVEKVHIPGASYLHVSFDPRCCTEENGDELEISPSADFEVRRMSFGGLYNYFSNFYLYGDTLHYRFISDYTGVDWGFKFTVTGHRVGQFDTGSLLLETLLSLPSVTRLLPLADIWRRVLLVACRQKGRQRLRTIRLLLLLLSSQSRDCASLKTQLYCLAPLWQLYQKLLANVSPGYCDVPSIVHALTELFYTAENLAVDWGIEREYVASLSHDSIIQAVIQGIKNVACVSLAVDYNNVAVECFAQQHVNN